MVHNITIIRSVGTIDAGLHVTAHDVNCEGLGSASSFAAMLPAGIHVDDARYRVGPLAAIRQHQRPFGVSVPMHTCPCVVRASLVEAYDFHAARLIRDEAERAERAEDLADRLAV